MAASHNSYSVTVAFSAEGEVYGEENYTVTAADESAAQQAALKLSEDSIYDDPRIDRTRSISHIEQVDAEEGVAA